VSFEVRLNRQAGPAEPEDDQLYVGGCRCGARWQGEAIAHCATCHLTFASATGFDAHMDGRREPPPGCRTEAELRKRGLEPNENGHWRRPMSDEARGRIGGLP
jgi:hypothetical protein